MKLLYSFRDTGLPTYLVEMSPGKFLGTADVTPLIFSIDKSGAYKTAYTFPLNPPTISGSFFPAVDGLAYGYATSNKSGTLEEVYSIGMKGNFTGYPYPLSQGGIGVGPVQYPDGSLYATSGMIVGNSTQNMLVRLTLQGVPTTIYTFSAAQGQSIYGNLVVGQDGNIYGLSTSLSGADAALFKITPAGAFSFVSKFSTGYYFANYVSSLIQATNGNFYGTLPGGGSAHAGSVYEITPAGQIKTLYSFPSFQTGIPTSLLQASDGQIYGTAQGQFATGDTGYSSIFKLDPDTGAFTTLYKFSGANVQYGQCPCNLIEGSDGILYGAGTTGGTVNNGTIFAFDVGLAPPPPSVQFLTPSAAAAGTSVLLFGNNLLGTTAVSFNGTPAAKFTVGSVQAVSAVVPIGATSGPITITTPNGTFTTTLNFNVQ